MHVSIFNRTGSYRWATLGALICLLVGACAQDGAKLAPQIGQKAPDAYKVGQAYQLSQEELGLDCKKITGRMQVRILQVRDADIRTRGSVFAQGAQAAVTPVFGGTNRGADPNYDTARDRAYLRAMNEQLALKKCATFNLDAELQPRSLRDTPTPVPQNAPESKKR